MNKFLPFSLLGCVAVAAAGCALEAAPDAAPESVAQQSSELGILYFWNSFNMRGITLNGRSLEGDDLTGHAVVGVSLDNVDIGKHRVRTVRLEETTFEGAGDIKGAVFSARLDTGASIPLRVDAVTKGSGINADLNYYALSYATANAWAPLCGVGAAGAPVLALPMSGRWDYRAGVAGAAGWIDDPKSFTFACAGHAIATCTELGYRPWLEARMCKNGSKCPRFTLRDLHQSCTRALRADYCGDGVSYTHDSTQISVKDVFDIRIGTEGWPFEAEWMSTGARCASRMRVPSLGTPSCWASLQQAECGAESHFANGTWLMTQELP